MTTWPYHITAYNSPQHLSVSDLNSRCGKIYHHTKLQFLTPDEILKLPEQHGILHVSKTSDPSTCILHQTRSSEIPDTITLGWDVLGLRVHKVIPNHIRCQNCQKVWTQPKSAALPPSTSPVLAHIKRTCALLPLLVVLHVMANMKWR